MGLPRGNLVKSPRMRSLTNTKRITAKSPFWRSLHPELFYNAIAMVLTLI
ncbi:hypothetical protein [Nostoc sp.]